VDTVQPDEPAGPDQLVELARRHRVATDYWDWQGDHVVVDDASIRAVLTALGVDVADDAAVRASLEAYDDLPWRRTLPATLVCRSGRAELVRVHAPHGTGVRVEIELEDGSVRTAPEVAHDAAARWIDGREVGESAFEVPGDLPLGWHRLRAHVEGDGGLDDPTATACLVVTPDRLELPATLRDGRVWGLMDQIYQVRSQRSWGIGDLGDLASVVDWAGRDLGADFVLVNPLHAAEPVPPMAASPYLPTTRRFVNPVYLRVEDVPGFDALGGEARARVEAWAADARSLNDADTIDRDAVWAGKRAALAEVFDVGAHVGDEDFRRFRAEGGEALRAFATWCALAERHGLPWTAWPAALQDPASRAVAEFREAHAHEVDFHEWLQWLLERQLAAAQRAALDAGMALGIVHDLAVGVHPAGADSWGLGDALARGVTVGAPPDQFNQLGQNWSQPPWRPDRLAELGYAPYRDMLRAVLKDSGGIRIDHVIGLFRLWWIPAGTDAGRGTYVRYDHEALIGILALEAHRAGAVVVGEDLGVVEPSAREYMAERGILGTSILWFEWDSESGELLAPEAYRELCLSTVTTHDLPPTAGYLGLEHVAVRERLGLLTRSVEEERAVEERTVARVRAALVARGLLDEGAGVPETVAALHAFLALTPSRMLGVAVPDLVGDVRAVNQPGTDREYPNWCVPLSGPDGRPVSLEQLVAAPFAREVATRLER
jgi:4-alpha-glucanotransferase